MIFGNAASNLVQIFIVFCILNAHQIILTHALIKKTQKTPQREIERAHEYKKDWQARNIDTR